MLDTQQIIIVTILIPCRLASPQKLGPFTDTGVVAKMSFGDGSTFVNGTIGLGPVEFVGFDIPKQGAASLFENKHAY